jgi:sigma-B regulation protein RsbU (phosphoserine phosphatase)
MIGGDFFDYQTLPGGRLGVGLGDITGKGPAAALLASLVQGVLASQAVDADGWPRATVGLLNRILLSRQFESKFVTLFLAALAPDGTLTYCNAAHNPPLLFAAGGVTRLETGGTIIGAFPEAEYEHGVVRLNAGDTLVVFSDGVSEAANAVDDEFGEARVVELIKGVLHEPPDRVLAAIIEGAVAFTGDVGPRDDLTALVLRMTAADGTSVPDDFGPQD